MDVVEEDNITPNLEVIEEPFFKTYLAYGLEPQRVIQYSAYKNTLIPVTTVSGLSFGLMLGGTFLVESIFDWPGLGWSFEDYQPDSFHSTDNQWNNVWFPDGASLSSVYFQMEGP